MKTCSRLKIQMAGLMFVYRHKKGMLTVYNKPVNQFQMRLPCRFQVLYDYSLTVGAKRAQAVANNWKRVIITVQQMMGSSDEVSLLLLILVKMYKTVYS
jgi:hypothetical protein